MLKTALLAASLVLVAGTTAACGGDDKGSDDAAVESAGAPTNASVDDFCGTFTEFFADAQKLGADAKDADVVQALKQVAVDLEKVGTPEDIPDDAREGFELTLKAIGDVPDDATAEEIDTIDKDFSEAEKKQTDAFDEYLGATCSDPSAGE